MVDQPATSQSRTVGHGACISCEQRRPLSAQQMCAPCQDGLQFITRPSAHREHERRLAADGRPDLEGQGFVVVTSFPHDNALWVCDFCNDQIEVADDQHLIPLLGTYALCGPCVERIPYWPEAWVEPSPRACGCDACQRPLAQAVLLDHLRHPQRGHDRGVER